MAQISRHVSRPLQFMGLDMNDLLGGFALFGLFNTIDLSGTGLLCMLIVPYVLKKIKAGQPRGILVQIGYHWGLPVKGALPPPKNQPLLSVR
jgi:hypothetical protein